MWNTVLFDLDGTLTDSQVGIINAISYALDHFGAHKERSELMKFIGPPLMESLPEYCGFSQEKSQEVIVKFREYYQSQGWLENAPYPGIPELLRDLKAAGLRLMVATSKPENMAEQVLEHFGLSEYFDRICGAPRHDPDSAKKADVIRAALSYVEDPSQAVMVGDRRHDAAGAHETGLPCIGVLYGYGDREELEAAGAEFIAEDLADLRKLLLFDVMLAEGWLNAFGAEMNLDRIRNACYTGCLWPPAPRNGAPVLEGEEARRAFDTLDYDTAYIFREGITQAGITSKVTADELDQIQNLDVYVVDKSFRWTYVHTHEDGWRGPYFCWLDEHHQKID